MRRLSEAEFADHFWERINKDGPTQPHMTTPCWVWTGCVNTGGYGSLFWRKRPLTAHRVAWELQHGTIPDGMCVLHECDYRPCVRHTYIGTKKNNSTLTTGQVVELRARYAAGGVTMQALAHEYGVWKGSISRIVCRHTWGDVP